MQRQLKFYNTIGHIKWPMHDSAYHDLAHILPERTGVMTVRLLVEDATINQSINVVPGRNAADDFLVATDVQPDTAAAHKYFSGDDVRIVDNVLLGATDWCGVKRAKGDPEVKGAKTATVEYFRCKYENLDGHAKKLYDDLHDRLPGAKLWLITSINKNKSSVNALMEEVKRTGLPVGRQAKVEIEPIACAACETEQVITIKPLISAKRLGWKKLGLKGRIWVCPKHNHLNASGLSELLTSMKVLN